MAWMAPISAAAQQRQEEMALLSKLREADEQGRYEFKIIRAGLNGFRNQDYLDQVLDTEMQGSWEFVEKIDNGRVILRRTLTSKAKDIHLDVDYDPYRINYGSGNANIMGIVIGLILLVGIMFFFGFQVLGRGTEEAVNGLSMPMIILSVGILLLLLIVVLLKLKRK
jgi:hypothetical protein